MTAFKALALRAALTFFDSFLGILVVGGIVKPDINVLEQAALAGMAAAIGVIRNGIALALPNTVPSTLPPTVTTP